MLFLQFAGAKVQKNNGLCVIGSELFCTFALNLTIYMKFIAKYGGFALILIGVLLFVTLQLLHFTFVNFITFTPLALVIGGVALHVWMKKRESSY